MKSFFPGNREKLPQPIEMQFYNKVKTISGPFTTFLKSTFYFQHVEQKDESHSLCSSGIIDCEIRPYVNV